MPKIFIQTRQYEFECLLFSVRCATPNVNLFLTTLNAQICLPPYSSVPITAQPLDIILKKAQYISCNEPQIINLILIDELCNVNILHFMTTELYPKLVFVRFAGTGRHRTLATCACSHNACHKRRSK